MSNYAGSFLDEQSPEKVNPAEENPQALEMIRNLGGEADGAVETGRNRLSMVWLTAGEDAGYVDQWLATQGVTEGPAPVPQSYRDRQALINRQATEEMNQLGASASREAQVYAQPAANVQVEQTPAPVDLPVATTLEQKLHPEVMSAFGQRFGSSN